MDCTAFLHFPLLGERDVSAAVGQYFTWNMGAYDRKEKGGREGGKGDGEGEK